MITYNIFETARNIVVREIFSWHNGMSDTFPKREIADYYALCRESVGSEKEISLEAATKEIVSSFRHFVKDDEENHLFLHLDALA